MLLKILILSQFFLWAMPDEPQVSIGQAFEVFQGQISVKVNWCHVAQNIKLVSIFLWAMPDKPQVSFSKALEVFQGKISVKVNGCHVAQNIIRISNFLVVYA